MNDLAIIYENNDKVAHAIQEYIRGQGRWPFTPRPFNRFDTAFTEWWLVPVTEWPAYKYGKLCFHKYPRTADGVLYTGYYVEKGLGLQLTEFHGVQKNHIMKSDWRWYEFVDWARSGKIDEVLERINDISQTRVRVLIEIHAFNKVPEPDTERSTPSDTIEFEIAPLGSKWQLIQSGQSVLRKFNGAVNIGDLVERMSDENTLDYFWMDLVVGVRFRYGGGSSPGWSASDVWMKTLQPWVELVR